MSEGVARTDGEVKIDRGDVVWIEPDDSRGPAPSYSHPHVDVARPVRMMSAMGA